LLARVADIGGMAIDIQALLKLEVPIIVVLGRRDMPVREVTALIPGAIIELSQSAESDLELLANNKLIGVGRAVKVGENYGLRISFIGNLRDRLQALASKPESSPNPPAQDAEALASAMMAGQT
jgi:flagellar motor switch protein FliN/FliY